MSLARDIADLASVTTRLDTVGGSEGALNNRNLMYNPKIEIAQRGTSFSYSSGQSTNLLDRWHVPIGSGYNFDTTISQSTTVPTGEGFKYSLKVEMDAAITPSGSENGGIGMKFEGQDFNQLAYGTSAAKSLTLSFWVRSNKTGVYCCQIHTNAADSTSGNKYQHVKEYTISVANTWEKKTLTFSGLTTQAITQTNTDGFRMLWWLSVGPDDRVATADTWTQSASYLSTSNQVNFADSASNEWYLTGVQLEVGDTATDFEHRTFGDELARCQRYYYRKGGDPDGNYAPAAIAYLTSAIQLSVAHPVQMRANPSVSVDGNIRAVDGQTSHISSGASITNISQKDTLAWYTSGGHSGMTQYRMYIINGQTSANYMEVDAEL